VSREKQKKKTNSSTNAAITGMPWVSFVTSTQKRFERISQFQGRKRDIEFLHLTCLQTILHEAEQLVREIRTMRKSFSQHFPLSLFSLVIAFLPFVSYGLLPLVCLDWKAMSYQNLRPIRFPMSILTKKAFRNRRFLTFGRQILFELAR
jgi:hypothetical protein